MKRKKGVVPTVTAEFPVTGSRAQIIGLTRRLFTTATLALAGVALTSVAFVLLNGRGEVIAVISVLAEIVVLVAVLSDLKRRIIGQAGIVHDQQRALTNQATRLRQQAKELKLSY
jgi:hypothetical protein